MRGFSFCFLLLLSTSFLQRRTIKKTRRASVFLLWCSWLIILFVVNPQQNKKIIILIKQETIAGAGDTQWVWSGRSPTIRWILQSSRVLPSSSTEPLESWCWLTAALVIQITARRSTVHLTATLKLKFGNPAKLLVSRERVVSLDTRTRTNAAKITALQATLTHVNPTQIPFAREKKEHGYFYFSRSTKWCRLYLNMRMLAIEGIR